MKTLDNQTARQVSADGERVYRERISSQERMIHTGDYVAIDPATGRYAFGGTLGEAVAALSSAGQVPLPFIRLVEQTIRLRHA